MVVEGTRVKGKDEDEMNRKRERKCALSCLNENKQLSDSLRTLKKTKTRKTFTNNFVLFLKKKKKTTPSCLLENNNNTNRKQHWEGRMDRGVGGSELFSTLLWA